MRVASFPSVRRRLRGRRAPILWRLLAICLGVVIGLPGAAQTAARLPPWRVVILQGSDISQPAAALQDASLRETLREAVGGRIEFLTDTLDALGFGGADLSEEFLALLRKKYESQRVDLVIAATDFALDFAERHHEKLWPGAPVMFHSVEASSPLRAPFPGVRMDFDIEGTLDLIARLQPDSNRLVIVSGAGEYDARWGAQAQRVAARHPQRWDVQSWQGLPQEELLRRLAALPARSAVLYVTISRDREGRAYVPAELVGPMAANSKAPIYGWHPTYLGRGVVAGSVTSFEERAQAAARMAARLLQGAALGPESSVTLTPHCVADARSLLRLGLDAARLPRECTVAFRAPSLWRDFKPQLLLAVAALVLQGALIAGLLAQRRALSRARSDARAGKQDLARAARFVTVGQLSASIAHEINQPLGAILSNADAAELLLDSPAPRLDDVRQILADIRSDDLRANEVIRRLRALLERHEVEHCELDVHAALADIVKVLTSEAARRGFRLDARLEARRTVIAGDRVQLQQVVLNLVLNAMDAMQETPQAQRCVELVTRDVRRCIEIEVADRGHGLEGVDVDRLFTSFYTTRVGGMGLGLGIARSIVLAHGGSLKAMPRPGGGAVFQVRLPTSDRTSIESPSTSSARSHQLPGRTSAPGVLP
jgi:signal transduction histidine kinase